MAQPLLKRYRTRLTAAVLLTVAAGAVVLAAALPGNPGVTGRDSVVPAKPLDDPFARAVARVRPSVAAVGWYDATATPSLNFRGTGFVVGDGQTVVTNAHVVEAVRSGRALDRLRVFFADEPNRQGRPATVVAEDSFHDVALIRFEAPAMTPLPLVAEPAPAQGQSVGIVGYPIGTALGLVPAAHHGVVAAVVPAVLPLPKGVKMTPQLEAAIKDPYNLYQLDMTVYPGNSGSPLFDEAGNVVGVINKTLATRTREHLLDQPSGISYAVPITWARLLVARAAAATRP